MTDPTDDRTGQCLCGSVTYWTQRPLLPVRHCHCENCRRTSGNFVAASRSATSDLHINDPSSRLRWYELVYARYGFCQECGSTLFYQAADRGDITSVMVGTLNNASGLPLLEVWFASEAQPHNTLADDIPHFAGNALPD